MSELELAEVRTADEPHACPKCDYVGQSYSRFALHYRQVHGDRHSFVAFHGLDRVKVWYERHSAAEIARVTGVSEDTVYRMVEQTPELEKRSLKESHEHYWEHASEDEGLERTRAGREAVKTDHVSLHTIKRGYERINCNDGKVRHHRLLAVAEFGFDAVKDKIVHHKNSIPWDNRPENLEIMTQAEHASLHKRQEAAEMEEA